VLSVLLWFTDSDYPFGILELFLSNINYPEKFMRIQLPTIDIQFENRLSKQTLYNTEVAFKNGKTV
jgi:hypothetical protein